MFAPVQSTRSNSQSDESGEGGEGERGVSDEKTKTHHVSDRLRFNALSRLLRLHLTPSSSLQKSTCLCAHRRFKRSWLSQTYTRLIWMGSCKSNKTLTGVLLRFPVCIVGGTQNSKSIAKPLADLAVWNVVPLPFLAKASTESISIWEEGIHLHLAIIMFQATDQYCTSITSQRRDVEFSSCWIKSWDIVLGINFLTTQRCLSAGEILYFSLS